jgi:hypothetical protein
MTRAKLVSTPFMEHFELPCTFGPDRECMLSIPLTETRYHFRRVTGVGLRLDARTQDDFALLRDTMVLELFNYDRVMFSSLPASLVSANGGAFYYPFGSSGDRGATFNILVKDQFHALLRGHLRTTRVVEAHVTVYIGGVGSAGGNDAR